MAQPQVESAGVRGRSPRPSLPYGISTFTLKNRWPEFVGHTHAESVSVSSMICRAFSDRLRLPNPSQSKAQVSSRIADILRALPFGRFICKQIAIYLSAKFRERLSRTKHVYR